MRPSPVPLNSCNLASPAFPEVRWGPGTCFSSVAGSRAGGRGQGMRAVVCSAGLPKAWLGDGSGSKPCWLEEVRLAGSAAGELGPLLPRLRACFVGGTGD